MLTLFLAFLSLLTGGFYRDAGSNGGGGGDGAGADKSGDDGADPGDQSKSKDTEKDQASDDDPATDDSSIDGEKGGKIEDLPPWAQEIIKETRAEAASSRKEKKDQEREFKRQQDAAKAEQGQFKELYEDVKPKYDTLAEQEEVFQKYQEAFGRMLTARLEKVEPYIRDLVANLDPLDALEWLEANAEKVGPRDAADLDEGKRSDQKRDSHVGSEEHREKVRKRFHINK